MKDIAERGPSYIGKRQVQRLMSDAYGKGIVRSNQETTNLRIGGRDDRVTSAESFHTTRFVQFPGQGFISWREAIYRSDTDIESLMAISVDWRNPHKRTPVIRNIPYLYGHRPHEYKDLWHLSPYEFMIYWKVELAEYARPPAHDSMMFQAILTHSGTTKIRSNKKGAQSLLLPGEDFTIKTVTNPHTSWWIPLPNNAYTEEYRHNWVFMRWNRPVDPSFAQCPMPRRGDGEQERTAALIMTYFHPWTLNEEVATPNVPYLGNLCSPGLSWHASMLQWFNGNVLSQETKRYIDKFSPCHSRSARRGK